MINIGGHLKIKRLSSYHQNFNHASKISPIKLILNCWVLRGFVYLLTQVMTDLFLH
jgi:hypothetical protein